MALSRRGFLRAGALGSALTLLPRFLRADPERPNILFVLLDDLGAEVLGSYGGRSYETPIIDSLAAEGLRFENGFASPTCIPSRVTALTGRYPFRSGLDEPTNYRGDRPLDASTPTFASLLRQAGYRTAVGGKWQLARLDLHPRHPQRCGFEESFLWTWSTGKRKTRRYWGAEIAENGHFRAAAPEEYGPDLYCDFLTEFMKRHRAERFLAFYPMTLVHTPFLPTPADGTLAWLASFESARNLMASSAVARFAGQDWFASMVAYADQLVGRLVESLDHLGIRERTLVLIAADNGTSTLVHSQLGDRSIEGGKDTLTEAGTRVPFIANWPGRIEAGVADDLVDLSDLLPTFADVAGAGPVSAVDGVSFAQRLLRGEPSARSWVFAQRSEHWFVRDRRWRLHEDGRLYDLRHRYSEQLAEPGPEADAARARLERASPMRPADPSRL